MMFKWVMWMLVGSVVMVVFIVGVCIGCILC